VFVGQWAISHLQWALGNELSDLSITQIIDIFSRFQTNIFILDKKVSNEPRFDPGSWLLTLGS